MNSEEETRVFEVDKVREIYGPNVIAVSYTHLINNARLFGSYFGRNKVLFDSISMDAVVDFGEFTLCRPAKLSLLFCF